MLTLFRWILPAVGLVSGFVSIASLSIGSVEIRLFNLMRSDTISTSSENLCKRFPELSTLSSRPEQCRVLADHIAEQPTSIASILSVLMILVCLQSLFWERSKA